MICLVDGNFVKQEGLIVMIGVYVDSLLENSVVGVVGVLFGDVIIVVNGEIVQSSFELQEQIVCYWLGDEVWFELFWEGVLIIIVVEFCSCYGNKVLVKGEKLYVVL